MKILGANNSSQHCSFLRISQVAEKWIAVLALLERDRRVLLHLFMAVLISNYYKLQENHLQIYPADTENRSVKIDF